MPPLHQTRTILVALRAPTTLFDTIWKKIEFYDELKLSIWITYLDLLWTWIFQVVTLTFAFFSRKILSTTGYIEVKQRAGCLSYIADKFGYHSQLARTLTHSGVVPWDPSPNSVIHFTSDKSIKLFCKHFLVSEKVDYNNQEAKLRQALTKITYDAVVKDKIIIIVVFMSLLKVRSVLMSI